MGPGIGKLIVAFGSPARTRLLPSNPTDCLSREKRWYEKEPLSPTGIMGRLSSTIPVPCQPLLNAFLVSLTGTLTPPPNPIVIGLRGELEATLAARSNGNMRVTRIRIVVPPSMRVPAPY